MFEVYQGRRVFVTGHTGFKGSWLCEWLLALGAEVYGFSNGLPTRPSLFAQLRLSRRLKADMRGDVRDRSAVCAAIRSVGPDFVFHLAAQPLVRLSYARPVETFETNVMGTVHVLDALRGLRRKCSAVLVTTDKCYENRETRRPYREDDPMGGYDPYSCSKGCDELVIGSYRRSFFNDPSSPVWIASARAGNVVGGGDWAKDRLVPDLFRALRKGTEIPVRNPSSTRPWQHVLEPLSGYLALGKALDSRCDFYAVASGFNFGPDPRGNRTVREVVEALLAHTGGRWIDMSDPNALHEAGLLNLDIRKAARVLGWKPRWGFGETMEKVAAWYVGEGRGENPMALTQGQIEAYEGVQSEILK